MEVRVVIVDCGTGNLSSVQRGLARNGTKSVISSRAEDILDCDKLILSGVGHFQKAMAGLEGFGLIDALNQAVLIDKKPVLGICLGMELMAKDSEEGTRNGLGWMDANVIKIAVADKLKYKVPHIGWNQTVAKKPSELMNKIADGEEFYFLHSYHVRLADPTDMLCETEYETAFASAIAKDNIYGVQFHPEKSHDAGLQFLKNFADL